MNYSVIKRKLSSLTKIGTRVMNHFKHSNKILTIPPLLITMLSSAACFLLGNNTTFIYYATNIYVIGGVSALVAFFQFLELVIEPGIKQEKQKQNIEIVNKLIQDIDMVLLNQGQITPLFMKLLHDVEIAIIEQGGTCFKDQGEYRREYRNDKEELPITQPMHMIPQLLQSNMPPPVPGPLQIQQRSASPIFDVRIDNIRSGSPNFTIPPLPPGPPPIPPMSSQASTPR